MRTALIIFAFGCLRRRCSCAKHAAAARRSTAKKVQSARQLETIEAALMRRAASANDRNTTLAQIREDFWRIQLANDELSTSLSSQAAIDSRLIAKTAAKIRTRAQRLKENLGLPRAEKDSRPQTGLEATDFRSSIATLSKLIDSFVSNPILSQKHVVDATLSLEVSRDLEDIIALSGNLKRIAAKPK